MHGTHRTIAPRLAALAITLCLTSSSFADGVIRDGLGAISIGRGGTNIAHSDNAAIVLDNPAGMVNVRNSGLAEMSFDTLLTDLRYTDPQNDVDGEVRPYPLAHMGFIRKDPTGLWAFGFGIFSPGGFGAEYDVVHPVLGMHRQKTFGALVKIMPSFAIRITDQLSVGAALGVGVTHAELEGPFHLQSGPIPGAPAVLDIQGSGASMPWNVGLQYEINRCTTFGLTYIAETRVRLDGNARATVPGVGFSTFDADARLTWPQSVGAGLLFKPSPRRRYSVDVIWFDWSHAFDDIPITLGSPSNPAFAGLLGNVFTDQFPLNWRDSVSVRTGVEHFTRDGRVLRAGYVYHRNPIPETTLTSYIPATLEHSVSVGHGWRCCGWSLDLAYQLMFGRARQVGTSQILGGDFNNSRVEAAAHWMSLSFQRRF